ncbi:MAG: histidinol-phosphatase HisJ family protein [Clostridia bacterium]|nr:histidinol-phosphatase HisJ family protein [Clostridia bacterium]
MNRAVLCDMHVHSQNSHDSTAPVRDTAEAGIKNGVSIFSITDHCDIQYYIERDMPSSIQNSIKETEQTAEKFAGKIKILKGIELGEGIWSKEHTEEILSTFAYDLVIGSVHAVRYKNYTDPYSTIDFSKMSECDLDAYMATYFEEVLEMVRQIPCDIMAHLTCPLRYINGKYGRNVDTRKYEDKIIPILQYLIDRSISMEINTSGVGTAYGCFMPDEWIIEKFRKTGGYLVTLGSDAHVSENVGKAFEQAINFLKRCGFKSYFYYQNRTPISIEL